MDPTQVFSLPSSQPDEFEEGSPTKKRRIDPHHSAGAQPGHYASQGSSDGAQASYSTETLRSTPTHITLWAIATSLRSSAQQLLPLLAKRPSSTSPSSQQRYSQLWASYVQQTTAAITALRAAARIMANESETKGTRSELRAQAMLAEGLIEVYEGTGEEGKIAGEADGAITRALAIAGSHPSLSAYITPLTLLQLRLALAVNKPLKFIRTSLKRLLASLPPIPSSSAPTSSQAHQIPNDLSTLSATIQALAFSARFESTSTTTPSSSNTSSGTAEALAAWRSIRELAQQTSQQPVWVVAALAELRLALLLGGLGELLTASALLEALYPFLGADPTPPPPAGEGGTESRPAKYPRALQVMYRLMYCLFKSQTGEIKEAKTMLKSAHRLLDLEMGAEEKVEPDRVRVTIEPADPTTHPGTELAIQVPPHHVLYIFAFLVSSVVHFDPYGKNPRAILFAEEGIRTAEGQLNGRETLPLVRSVAAISTHLRASVPCIVRLHLNLASLATMRSSYPEAERHLLDAVTLLCAFAPTGGWAKDLATTNKILLGWAQVRIARAARDGTDEREAQEALEAVLWRFENNAGSKEQEVASTMATTKRIAALSLLLLRLSDEDAISSTFSASQDPVIRTLLETIHSPAGDEGDLSAHSKLLSALASALTETTITASKTALSDALTLANAMQANYARLGILALLANVFLYTRDREAQKMLASALKLAQQMGAPEKRSCVVEKGDKAPTLVGNARLALWSGERLLEMYKAEGKEDKIREQTKINLACRMLLEQDERDAEAAGALA
ncbi:hypothetical protein JCM10908_005631 [Rhodotorula pacifica]|uniref:uncharacterized protein n=1 Tax=Rhodotorula pacifica TaxID=1495444 RepID=UPI0031707710